MSDNGTCSCQVCDVRFGDVRCYFDATDSGYCPSCEGGDHNNESTELVGDGLAPDWQLKAK